MVTDSTLSNGGSAWNTAGTFESKNYTPWAKQKLEEVLKAVTFTSPTNGALFSIKEIKEISGDAEITMNRGKRKHLCGELGQ